MLNIVHARLQHYANQEIPDVQGEIRKAEEPEFKRPTFAGSQRKQQIPEKHLPLFHQLC